MESVNFKTETNDPTEEAALRRIKEEPSQECFLQNYSSLDYEISKHEAGSSRWEDTMDSPENENELTEPLFVAVEEEPHDAYLSADNFCNVSNSEKTLETETSNARASEVSGKEENEAESESGARDIVREEREAREGEGLQKEERQTSSFVKTYSKPDKKTTSKSFPCEICSKHFEYNYQLENHKCELTSENAIKCSVCGKAFSLNAHLVTHMRIHTREKPFNCSICGRDFAEISKLMDHRCTTTGEKLFDCSVCKEVFSLRSTLMTHKCTPIEKKLFKCYLCEKAFAVRSSLTMHLHTHYGILRFKCSICKKAFLRSGQLTRHEATHTGEQPFACSICGRSFTHACRLSNHKRLVHATASIS